MSNNYFSLFGLPVTFNLDSALLSDQYRQLAARFHPDKVAGKSGFEQKEAVMMASSINEAYRTLKHPLNRAAYLLKLQGIDTDDPAHTQFAPEFLMQQMDWREALESATEHQDSIALMQLHDEIDAAYQALLAELAQSFSELQDPDTIAQIIRQGRFIDKLQVQLHETLEQLPA